jgi:hypothetical protein
MGATEEIRRKNSSAELSVETRNDFRRPPDISWKLSMKKTIGVVCIVKDEVTYILEWVSHYRSLGLDNIIVYDHESVDGTTDLVEALQARGVLQAIKWCVPEGTSPQLSAYMDAIVRFRYQFEFLAFFDADEFLTPRVAIEVPTWLSSLNADVGAIAINQRVFGSSGQKTRQSGLVIERFRRASDEDYEENRWVKSIYRVSAVEEIKGPHHGVLSSGRYILPNGEHAFDPDSDSGKARSIDFSLMQLNHYIIKSEEEFLVKRQRGEAMSKSRKDRLKRYEDMDFFHGRDQYINSSLDETLVQRSQLVTAEIRALRNLLGASICFESSI